MNTLLVETYKKEQLKAEALLKEVQKKINIIVTTRVLLFFLIVFGCYTFSSNTLLAVLIGVLGSLVFIYLVQVHAKLSTKKNYFTNKVSLNKTELNVLNGAYSDLENGSEFLDANHEYSYDIDLFGEGTFFQFFNRTNTDGGKIELAKLIQKNDISDIINKQDAIKELAPDLEWRQHFLATSSNINSKFSSQEVSQWILNYESFIPKKLKIVLFGFPIASILFIILLSFDVITSTQFVIWFLIGMGITGFFVKKTTAVYQKANEVVDTINEYAGLLTIIEKKQFSTVNNLKKQKEIETKNAKASETLLALGKTLNRLNSRNNLIVAIFGNALFLWELNAILKFEKWIETNKETIPKWFDSIYYFDAQLSCANYAYNHSSYAFPTISTDATIINALQLGHPLLDASKRIDNNIVIKDNNFVIITGANMAGKSTFLRTISLNLILANAGMPVCAKSFNYRPIQLITSMRTSDSLKDDESYFFSELKRLKFIVDKIKDNTYFIILDEILKGTNSKDKEIGSKKFVQKLVRSGSTGIIATHDLALCTITEEFPQVVNHYFDAEIINDELHFDYKMKDGVCKNMNASFLLKKMEIV